MTTLQEFQDSARALITAPNLSYRQRVHQLALLAEDLVAYPKLSAAAEIALEQDLVSDLLEGHAPYRPRYILPDYGKAIEQGSEYLELDPPETFDDALSFLQILYHNVPSITTYPVYLGDLDSILDRFVDDSLSDKDLYEKIARFWRFLDRTIPDAFTHANIGPSDSRLARTILRVDRDLAQVVPNLTLKYDPAVSGSELLSEAAESIAKANKPHIANHPMIEADFPGGYGVVSCYNTLPLAGGSHTLVRLNLKKSLDLHEGDVETYLRETLMAHIDLTFEIMRARIGFLVEESGFFDHHFLAKEGLIDRHRFTAMFGIYGTAELVNGLLADQDLRYGHDDQANQLAGQILEIIADRVENEPMPYCWNQRAVFHSQSGISTDEDTTAGARVPTGTEPETIEHILAVAPHHELFKGGVSDIFALDETVRANPAAIADVTLGAFEHGMREITFNVENCDLVRITGYMVRLSDIEKWRNEGSRINSTVLGADSVDNWHLLDRTPRVISNELDPRPRQ